MKKGQRSKPATQQKSLSPAIEPTSTAIRIEEYNALIDLQVAVRNETGQSPSMLQAIRAVTENIRRGTPLRLWIEKDIARSVEAKRQAQDEISRNAAKM